MPQQEHRRIVTLAYHGEEFRFGITEESEDILEGFFIWSETEKARLYSIMDQEDEEDKQPWYLDDHGCRLEDTALFEKSPWSVIDGICCSKAVQRFMDFESGASWFSLTPWFCIGDELNRPPIA